MATITANRIGELRNALNLNHMLRLTESKWMRLGRFIAKWIRQDAKDGRLQGAKDADTYRSEQYKLYKRNQMRRMTVGEGKVFTDKEGYFFGTTYFDNKKAKKNKKTGRSTGKRLKAYFAEKITSTQTSFVDMTLTGKLLNSLRPRRANAISVEIAVDPEHTGKVLGNRNLGREVLTMNDENKAKLRDKIVEDMNKGIQDFYKQGTIVINIGK